MDKLQSVLAVLGIIGAILTAVKAALKEWTEIQKLLKDLIKPNKRKKDDSPTRPNDR
ncbi:hypothetical protein PASE110613_11265 [Paenibacillus sediminis]|uniref:Uncharacterized protein n=1 Tax=Paenibacillus sediminis TaxID=664909 RepID=A0ABS4H4S1_9BACL|nr:hypothetical protein [Paenibacillus sediminis]MBP1937534.1 hypothetical protein [Paenibacillus sediminis]